MAGITTIEADNGSLAIDIISRFEKPQEELCAILLDMMLPTVNGLGVLAYLKGRGNSIPVIAMSADRNLLAEAIKSDAHAAIAKPFDVHELLSIVTNQCQCK